MPVEYSGITHEHMAVRTRAGLFDVSHMGEADVKGPEALKFLQHLVTNDCSKLFPGRVLYTVMCYPHGGVVDDLLVYMTQHWLPARRVADPSPNTVKSHLSLTTNLITLHTN